ncbi:pantoate--beta-alanine ligase [Aurantiacibacter rhizosphaerae]|uniref:Pantothenate synthetase n=1 Tax=Aurantiacibacter rhizosphaerae TaxID=2691582 RepID=A0A844XE05_9SPHN|nr:pantoate--beta-alanine ligase [Aurantiacibacter rhizosphaerae]MWV28717.1 pantoate--beta-alanine ligase [Aurantiacibacter rhizosphaerae]
MQTVTTLPNLRLAVDEIRKTGTIALVPTMGALHEGHLTLVREAAKLADHVAVSIFVNPRQFGEGEDLDAYPRQLAEDSAKLEAEGVVLLWAPDASAMYPQGYATNISVNGVSDGLCGADRPGHFDGVATVVCKLFNQVRPDIALFGEKDWQQLAVIRRMARDLDLVQPHADAIHGAAIVRDPDGLAMSSRNAYLSATHRAAAATLPRAMDEAIARIRDGQETAATLAMLEDELLGAGFSRVDYAELRDADSIAALDGDNGNARLFVAARIGQTRLIDNKPVSSA